MSFIVSAPESGQCQLTADVSTETVRRIEELRNSRLTKAALLGQAIGLYEFSLQCEYAGNFVEARKFIDVAKHTTFVPFLAAADFPNSPEKTKLKTKVHSSYIEKVQAIAVFEAAADEAVLETSVLYLADAHKLFMGGFHKLVAPRQPAKSLKQLFRG